MFNVLFDCFLAFIENSRVGYRKNNVNLPTIYLILKYHLEEEHVLFVFWDGMQS